MERNYQPTEEQIKARQEKRELLKILSKALKPSIEAGNFQSMTEALVDFYSKQGHRNLKTFNQWKEAGYSVKKGMTALSLWGTQRTAKAHEGDQSEYNFFPVAHVFSEIQVEKRGRTTATPPTPEMAPAAPVETVLQPVETSEVIDDLPF
jgi:hypothetical protein